jgi:hypothetical protein
MERICVVIAPSHLRDNRSQRDAAPASAARDSIACAYIEVRFVSARERYADRPGQIDFAIWLGEQEFAAPRMAIFNLRYFHWRRKRGDPSAPQAA